MQGLNSYEWNMMIHSSGDDKNPSKIPKDRCVCSPFWSWCVLQLTDFSSLPSPGATQTVINEKVSVEQLCAGTVWAGATNQVPEVGS